MRTLNSIEANIVHGGDFELLGLFLGLMEAPPIETAVLMNLFDIDISAYMAYLMGLLWAS